MIQSRPCRVMQGESEKDMEGFYKVSESGGTFVTGIFYNPETKEERHEVLRDYDYSDGSRDNDELYYMQINKKVRWQWLHAKGVIQTGDTVKVVKGRKVPIGTVAKVTDKKPFYDRYRRWQADYLYLDNGMKTNCNNCILIEEQAAG